MKKIIKLTESDLHRIIRKSVNNIIKESDYMDDGELEKQYARNFDSKWNYYSNGDHDDSCCYTPPQKPTPR